jgi:hypothetical protein
MNEKITIARVKKWREEIDATRIVVFAIGRDGMQHVATHGETKQDAKVAADAGNRLKSVLGWTDDLCHAVPLERICQNCRHFELDYSEFDNTNGRCELFEAVSALNDTCDSFEPGV